MLVTYRVGQQALDPVVMAGFLYDCVLERVMISANRRIWSSGGVAASASGFSLAAVGASWGGVMSASGARCAVLWQRRWWSFKFTRNQQSGQTHFPFCQSAQALRGFRCLTLMTLASSYGWALGQSPLLVAVAAVVVAASGVVVVVLYLAVSVAVVVVASRPVE